MTDESKELIKKDLVTILQLNQKIHYDNISEVENIHNLLLQKKILKTSLGNKYIKRLEQLIKATDSKSCVLCNNNLDNQTLICNNCLNKFVKPKVENANKNIAQTTVRPVNKLDKKAAQEAKDVINTQTGAPSKKPEKALLSKTKIILGIIVALILLGALLDNGSSKTTRETISNGNEAHGIVQEFYPLDDFYISLNETTSVPKDIFDGNIGKQVDQDAFMGEEQVGVYCFGVTSKDGTISGQVWVSDNGGVIQFGLEGDGNFYLIK